MTARSVEDFLEAVVERLKTLEYAVQSIERKQARRNPYPPFTTSTLQQEASRKLGMGATRTIRVAQKLRRHGTGRQR